MMERLRFNGGMSAEGSGDTGIGESGGSVGVFWLDEWSTDKGDGASVLDLLTGLRAKRDFLEDLSGEGSIERSERQDWHRVEASRPPLRSILHLI
jgi:hypothetical protein